MQVKRAYGSLTAGIENGGARSRPARAAALALAWVVALIAPALGAEPAWSDSGLRRLASWAGAWSAVADSPPSPLPERTESPASPAAGGCAAAPLPLPGIAAAARTGRGAAVAGAPPRRDGVPRAPPALG